MRKVKDYNDDAAQKILRRAIEIHTDRKDLYSDDELKAVALELGVTPDIIEQAIEEYEESRTISTSGTEETGEPFAIPVLAALAGLLAAMVANGRNGHGILAFWISVVAIVAAALVSKGRSRHLVFQLSNAAYWIVVTIHTLLMHPLRPDFSELAVPNLAFLLTFGVVGGLIVERQRRAEARKSPGGDSPRSGTGEVSGLSKLIARVRRFAGLHMLAIRVRDDSAEPRISA